jgi:hypothetical protein
VSPPWVHNGLTLVIPSFVHAVQGRLGACHSHRRHWLGVSTADAVRLGVCSALTLVSPPRAHARDPVVRARSAGQAGGLPFSPQPPVGCLHRRRGRPGMLGVASSALTLLSPPRVHARDPVVRARSAGWQAGGLPFSPQPPVGCLHRRRGRLGMLGAHARESASGSHSRSRRSCTQCRASWGLAILTAATGWVSPPQTRSASGYARRSRS